MCLAYSRPVRRLASPAASESLPRAESQLPPLPESLGGAFAGVSNDALIVAGGATISETAPDQAERIYSDEILVLENASEWRTGTRLPRPLAYGLSITTEFWPDLYRRFGLQRAHPTVLLLEWVEGKIKTNGLPDLPQPRAGPGLRVGW